MATTTDEMKSYVLIDYVYMGTHVREWFRRLSIIVHCPLSRNDGVRGLSPVSAVCVSMYLLCVFVCASLCVRV